MDVMFRVEEIFYVVRLLLIATQNKQVKQTQI